MLEVKFRYMLKVKLHPGLKVKLWLVLKVWLKPTFKDRLKPVPMVQLLLLVWSTDHHSEGCVLAGQEEEIDGTAVGDEVVNRADAAPIIGETAYSARPCMKETLPPCKNWPA